MDNGNFILAHLSDLHLGYHSGRKMTKQGINWREVDAYKALHSVVSDIINDGTVDAVLIAGDVFHTPEPSITAVMIAQKEFRRLSDAGMPVYALTGNHDVSDIKSELAATALLNDPERHIFSHWEDYAKHEIGPGIILHMVSHHLYKEQASTWDKVHPEPGAINIFTTHGAMIDPITKMQLHTEQSPREVVIPDDIIRNPDWTYRLLGHIHERGFVGSKTGARDDAGLKTYYNGSLIRRGFSDGVTPLGRGWTKWYIQPDGLMRFEAHEVAQRPQFDFPVIDASALTASDITSLIIDNLDRTDSHSDGFAAAPILRQKVVNISPEKKRALDNNAINDHADHALIWSLSLKKDDADDSLNHEVIGQTKGSSLSEQYDNWLNDSETYKKMHDEIKTKVADETKKFIALGQESVLDEK